MNTIEKNSSPRLIVIGASAGGIKALIDLVKEIPADFPGMILVVVHVPAHARSLLPEILTRSGKLQAIHPADGQEILPGKIYVAPPDRHMLVEKQSLRLAMGPLEHHCRPAVDPLFQSAAHSYGPRVVGVILSGTLDDGTAGLITIKERGGIAIAQDPSESAYPDMPLSAIQEDHVDYILPVTEIATTLIQLAKETVEQEEVIAMSDDNRSEAEIVEQDMEAFEKYKGHHTMRTVLSCPDCGGVLWEIYDSSLVRYRCQVGHAYSEKSLLASQGEALEAALWSAVRALEERAALTGRMASRAAERGQVKSEKFFHSQNQEAERSADVIREILLKGNELIANKPEESSTQVTDQPVEE